MEKHLNMIQFPESLGVVTDLIILFLFILVVLHKRKKGIPIFDTGNATKILISLFELSLIYTILFFMPNGTQLMDVFSSVFKWALFISSLFALLWYLYKYGFKSPFSSVIEKQNEKD